MISRNPDDYVIVTKLVDFEYHLSESDKSRHTKFAEELLEDEPVGLQKTFWLIGKYDGYIQRYSTASCPRWVRQVYELLTGTKVGVDGEIL